MFRGRCCSLRITLIGQKMVLRDCFYQEIFYESSRLIYGPFFVRTFSKMRKKAGEKKVEASARTRKQEIRAASLFSPSSPCTLDFFFLWRFQCRAPRKLVDQNPNSCLRFLYCLWLQSLFRFLVYVESCRETAVRIQGYL